MRTSRVYFIMKLNTIPIEFILFVQLQLQFPPTLPTNKLTVFPAQFPIFEVKVI